MPTRVTPWEDSVQSQVVSWLYSRNEPGLAGLVHKRALEGLRTYGTYLGPDNPGRSSRTDLLEELLDALVYSHCIFKGDDLDQFRETMLTLIRKVEAVNE